MYKQNNQHNPLAIQKHNAAEPQALNRDRRTALHAVLGGIAAVVCTGAVGAGKAEAVKAATAGKNNEATTLPPQTSSAGKKKMKQKVEFHIAKLGVITLELDAEHAPKTVANFVNYVQKGHYNGTIFHRVIENFMIQGGGMDANMNEKPAPDRVENEANNGLKNEKYTVAMARTQDPHSAGAQFFINVKNNEFLNHSSPTPSGWGYCVFGKVVAGTDVVEKIKSVATGRKGFHDDVPKEPILIEKAVLI